MSRPLKLLRLLDCLQEWNAQFDSPEERETVPEGTKGITVDEEVAGELADQLGVPRGLVSACLHGVPVKQAQAVREWVLSFASEEDYDPALLLYRWTNGSKSPNYVTLARYEEITGRTLPEVERWVS